jgi:hypothetical protein
MGLLSIRSKFRDISEALPPLVAIPPKPAAEACVA